MEVKIISREAIRPSSPTPPHLKLFHLSFLDQSSPLYYVPLTCFYHLSDGSPSNVNQILHQLKDSLSKALSIYYPIAGRIKDNLSIDCTDEGALFVESRVSCHLAEFLEKPPLDILGHLLPRLDNSCLATPSLAFQLAIQANVFASGGIAIGVRFLHKIIDGATAKAFLQCWTAIASGTNDKPTYPNFTAASLVFPPRQSKENHITVSEMSWFVRKERGVCRRFVFSASAISSLKAKATSQAVPNPTRSEVVAAFIWKTAVAASRALGSQNPSMMKVLVNVRPKTVPPVPETSIGNNSLQALAHHKREEEEEEEEMDLKSVTSKLREAVKKIDGDYVRSLQGEEGFLVMQRTRMELGKIYFNQRPDVYTCSSLLMFGFYDLDFGWGKPVWVAISEGLVTSSPMFPNTCNLMETKSGKGVEAWVMLAENHMAKLQSDEEFLTFASFNPSISIPVLTSNKLRASL